MLTKQQMREYEMLKAYLFDETLDSPLTIVRKLRKYTRSFLPQRGLNLLNLSKIYKQYIKGIKNVWITDAKVDIFLKQEFDRHIGDVNTFIEVLNG